jgi:hypothetical protein
MKLTREVISEALSLGKGVMPKMSAVELAQILDVSLWDMLKSIQANFKNFRFDAEKNITGLDATGSVQTMNSTEVWTWYLKNRLGGVAERCLPLSDQNRLNASVNSRVKWEANFGLATCTFASLEKSGTDVTKRVTENYGNGVASRVTFLGTISGSGQIPDRYLFGVILTEDEIKARRICNIPLYSPDWAMEEMLAQIDWVVIDTKPVILANPRLVRTPDLITEDAQPTMTVDETAQEAILAAGKIGLTPAALEQEKAQDEQAMGSKKGRRTKEQLDEAREKMNADLMARGVSPADAVKCFNIESFTEAEKYYKSVLKSLQVSETPVAPPASAPPVVEERVIDHPAQTVMPEVAAIKPNPLNLETPPAPAHHRQSAMPTIAGLEGVADLKADIRAKAGGVAPQPMAQTPVAPPVAAAVAAAPSIPLAPPPVAAAVPAGASSSAEDLLNSLLKTTGQA